VKIRRTSSALVFLMHCLGAAVFAWGFQAKLSVYYPPTPSHPISVVKIISDQQMNKATRVPNCSHHRSALRLPIDSTVASFQPNFAACRSVPAGRFCNTAFQCHPQALFFRSPPSDI
jgi:hypothetical protein